MVRILFWVSRFELNSAPNPLNHASIFLRLEFLSPLQMRVINRFKLSAADSTLDSGILMCNYKY